MNQPRHIKSLDLSVSKEILELLEKASIPISDDRVNTGRGRTQVLGNIKDRRGKYHYSGYTKKNMELYEKLKKFGESICPFSFHAIQLNKNYEALPHKDKNNKGESLIVGFGDYKGGELNVRIDGDTVKQYDIRTPLLFNGTLYTHWVDKIESGTRYSMVFFRNIIEEKEKEEIEEKIEENKDDYVVCILSYKRAELLNKNTLKMLKDNNIDKNKIEVYVANNEEYEEYKKILNPDLYKEIIVGIIGKVPQTEFVINRYPENKKILFLDDDVENIDLSLSELFKENDLNYFLNYAFNDCLKSKSYIFGIYPVNNVYFRKDRDERTIDLTFLVGAFYGVINRPNNENIKLKITNKYSQKDDVERSIKYFINDGILLRYNRIGFKTKYYRKEGGLGGLTERLPKAKEEVEDLKKIYNDFGVIKIRKNGIYEFKLKKIKSVFQ